MVAIWLDGGIWISCCTAFENFDSKAHSDRKLLATLKKPVKSVSSNCRRTILSSYGMILLILLLGFRPRRLFLKELFLSNTFDRPLCLGLIHVHDFSFWESKTKCNSEPVFWTTLTPDNLLAEFEQFSGRSSFCPTPSPMGKVWIFYIALQQFSYTQLPVLWLSKPSNLFSKSIKDIIARYQAGGCNNIAFRTAKCSKFLAFIVACKVDLSEQLFRPYCIYILRVFADILFTLGYPLTFFTTFLFARA